jgi:hypothetical protein
MARHCTTHESARLPLEVIEEKGDQALAIAMSLERMLGESCNDGENPLALNAPLIEWRLAQVLKDLLEKDTSARLRATLGFEPRHQSEEDRHA